MIPTLQEAQALWDKYQLPEKKRVHGALVAKVALFLANRLVQLDKLVKLDKDLVLVAALLHDIDKNIPKLPGEQHPDAGVRILRQEGMEEVANLVKTHPLHCVLDPAIAPHSGEEKLLFLADKMVKQEIITVDKRFALWNAEHLPPQEQDILDRAYPKVKALEREIFDVIGMQPEDVVKFA